MDEYAREQALHNYYKQQITELSQLKAIKAAMLIKADAGFSFMLNIIPSDAVTKTLAQGYDVVKIETAGLDYIYLVLPNRK